MFEHNFFDSLTKLFSNLYSTKFLDISTKPFFSMFSKVEGSREEESDPACETRCKRYRVSGDNVYLPSGELYGEEKKDA